MKFWQKAFLGILVVFIFSINICLYLTSNYSFSLNLKRDSERALGEYHFVVNGINDTMNTIYYRDQALPRPASIESFMRSYADYYQRQNVFLELSRSGTTLFGNIPAAVKDGYQAWVSAKDQDAYTVEVTENKNNGIHYLAIRGSLGGQFGDYTLTYVRDLSELYHSHGQLTRYLIIISVLVETLLTLALLLILKRLTRPIGIMERAARKIAGGVYDERIFVPGKDEFHDLAENFNHMALSIQEKISELDKNARDKQQLIDNLAHELRTPLTAIRGYAEYLQSAHTSEARRIKAAGYIMSETDRMKNLAFKLLDLALVRNSKLDLQKINPFELLQQVKAAAEPKLNENGQRLAVRCTLNKLWGDAILLESLLLNLVDNASKASAEYSTIELSAYVDAVPILEVKDSGCGMDQDQISRVCEPFYRVDEARSRSSGGVGLGLSLCREIARLHEAELKISSSPGQGTTIQVVFTASLQPAENSLMPAEV